MNNGKKRVLLLILLIGTYLLAFVMNFMPAIKHPDLNLDRIDLITSILFAIFLLMYSSTGSKKLRIFSMFGIFSGIAIFLIVNFESVMSDNFILNTIASIQYPLFSIFTIPFFGVNLLFDVNYATYSLYLSLFYVIVLGLSNYFKKKNEI
ncbi:hypothetical protein [Lysinibacillus boronitolerans]|uniref:hypothetical protein n=1 Tax=Lysinibacillus boronitolerans TaxID=309788 RepID=UPI003851E710